MKVLDQFKLNKKVIIITGGAGLLGSQYAKAICEAGGIAIIADLDYQKAQNLARKINRTAKNKAEAFSLDVVSKESVTNLVKAVLKKFKRIDGLINNAAIDPKFENLNSNSHPNSFEDFPKDLWDQSIDVNTTGMFLCAQAVAPVMLKQKKGSIINICSTYGLVGPDQSLYQKNDPKALKNFKPVTYSVTKSAVLGLTSYLATYWAGKGIRVNTLSPGGVYNNHDQEFVKRYSAHTTLGRMAKKDEYNAAIIFLLSDASSYMSGANLVIDGGWTAW